MTGSSTTFERPDTVNDAAIHEHRLPGEVTLLDVDQEIGLTLASLGCEFDRREAGGTVTYLIGEGSEPLGRLVIAAPSRVFPFVRVREVHLGVGFEAISQLIRRDLEALSWTAEQAGSNESSRYSYPRPQRRRIVEEYRLAQMNGEVENKETWAQNAYHITRKTLWRYECEFPEN